MLFEPDIGEGQSKLAGMAISASLESELRATVFEPFKQLHGKVRGGPEVRSAPSAPRDALAKFVEGRLKGQITLGPMIGCLVRIANPSEGYERLLRDWLKKARPYLYGALSYGKLKEEVVDLRNKAVHETVEYREAIKIYALTRTWLEKLTRDK